MKVNPTIKIKEIILRGDYQNEFSLPLNSFQNPEKKSSYSVLIGPNGCGKSTIINSLVDYFRKIRSNADYSNSNNWLRVDDVIYSVGQREINGYSSEVKEYFNDKYVKAFCFGMFCESKIQDNYLYKLVDGIHSKTKMDESDRIQKQKPFNLKDFVSNILIDLFSIESDDVICDILKILKIDNKNVFLGLNEPLEINTLKKIYYSHYYDNYQINDDYYYPRNLYNYDVYEKCFGILSDINYDKQSIDCLRIVGTKNFFNFLFKLNNIKDIDINIGFFFRKDRYNYVNFTQLSSGELSLLSCLVSASIEENSIVFIDEPEVNLHPNWQMDFIKYLDDVAIDNNNHFIIATHSHFLVSSLPEDRSEVIAIKKDEEGRISAELFQEPTFCWSAEQVLLEVFDVPTDRNRYIADMVRQLVSKMQGQETEILDSEIRKLRSIGERLKEVDPLKKIIEVLTKSY